MGHGIAESSYVTASGKAGPTTPAGARVKYSGAAVAMTGGATAQVRIHSNSVIGGPIIDTFILNASKPSDNHFMDPGVDAFTGIYVEVVSGTVDVVVYWR